MTDSEPARGFDPSAIDHDAFARDVRALRREIDASLGEDDLAHLRKMERWGRACTAVGLATAGVCPNPVSIVALAMGRSARWMLMHHVGHRGYDRVPGVPAKYTSRVFARGHRRFLDWADWMVPEAWIYEHNVLHHSFTGESRDPDLVERNMASFHATELPRAAGYAAFGLYALTWKFLYYAPSTLGTWMNRAEVGSGSEAPHELEAPWSALLLRCYLPYAAFEFGALPALYLPFGPWAWLSALTNSLAAEAVANVHTFCVIGPNHTGDDLYRFDDRPRSRGEAYVRQVVASANYRCGSDAVNFTHMWLNYQIEHHVFPDLPMRQYQLVQPKLKALCAKHGVPYVQGGVMQRVKKLVDVFVGKTRMKRMSTASRSVAVAALTALIPACGTTPSTANGDGGGALAPIDGGGSSSDGASSPSDGGLSQVEGGSSLDGGATTGTSSAAGLATKLGKPSRLLIGLGSSDPNAMKTQALKPDLYEEYLVGVGATDWTTWNSPSGSYVNAVAATADTFGAVPMFTLYQMATNGDGNLADLGDAAFMTAYWANVVLLFQRLAVYAKPALVNFEPDFWGYTEQASPGGDPTKLAAKVSLAADCASLTDDVSGLAHCLVRIARKYAPKAYVGFSPSEWGAQSLADVVTYMQKIGAGDADVVVVQTLDRDGGCFEAATEADCKRQGSGWYWDETNATHPNFHDHLATAKAFHDGLDRPLVWWQTPLGVPSATPGGTTNHYRDNRVHYFLTHPAELVAVGGLGVVFGAGSSDCTEIATDDGQWKTLSTAYFASPAALP